MKKTNLEAMARSAIALAVSQDNELRQSTKDMADAIASASDQSAAAQSIFNAVHADKVAAEAAGQKKAASAIAAAWNRVKPTLRHHLKESHSLSVTFGNLKDGSGSAIVETLPEASDRRKAESEARKAAESSALAAFRQDQAAAEHAALRQMGPDDLAASILETLKAWSHDRKQRAAVMKRLAEMDAPRARRSRKSAALEPKAA